MNSAPKVGPLVVAEDIHKSYDGLEILHGISISIDSGDLVSIIGSSGCGKSTFLRCLNLLETFDSGSVAIAGIGIERPNLLAPWTPAMASAARELRKHVGMVFQALNLFPHYTVLENVMLAPMVVNHVAKAAAREQAVALLDKVGLKPLLDRYPSSLSGGQAQRAAIARALAMSPQVMLYDEPTSALDPALVGEVLHVMRDLDREGMTQIVVTHEMHFARDASDYIIYMEAGQIVEISDEDDIFTKPKDPRTAAFLKRYR